MSCICKIDIFENEEIVGRVALITLLCLLPFILTSCAENVDFNKIMAALRGNLVPIKRLIIAASYVMGVWMIYSSLYALKVYGDMRTMMPSQGAGMAGPFFRLMIGVFLMMLPGMVKIGIESLWGVGSYQSVLELPSLSPGMEPWHDSIAGVIAIVRILGYVSLLRGFTMLAKATNKGQAPPGLYGKGLLHIVGGIMAINIIGTIDILRNSMGMI